ncbi:MAG: hypothetical protein H0W72_14920, partial [Planctomycetes bacterium]|nr:hypothetical protein [Planctomycetota bacterium]
TGARAIADGYRAAGGSDHEHHDDKATAASAAARRLAGGPTTVLVKASRSSGLEVVVEALMAAQSNPSVQGR